MNSTIKAVAIDDEKHALLALEYELGRHCPDVELIHQFQDPHDASDVIAKGDFDILFLDIQMDSTNGIEFLESIMPIDFEVVFVTAFDEFAIKAFELHAAHYLLKPVSGKKLKSAIDKISKSKSRQPQNPLDQVIKSLQQDILKIRKVPLHVQDGIEYVEPDEIIHIKGDGNYISIHLSNNRKIVLSKTVKDMEEILPETFLRIHKSHLINSNHLKKYVKVGGPYVIMSNGDKLAVSRTKKTMLGDLFQ